MVYVISKEGFPLMPCKEAKARKLLRDGKARIYKREPFAIQLNFTCENQVQDITLGVDTGSKHIGLSATTEDNVLYEADVILRNDIVDLLSTRREFRKVRRNHKTRYRKVRFNNRVSSKHKGRLAPSIENKINAHITSIKNVCQILPIKNIIVETAQFDIQKINNPNISGKEYQEGQQLGWRNVREYVLFRDNHTCQCCKGKSKDNILQVHHIESRKVGGDAPNNLVTLCKTCHEGYHKGIVQLPKTIKRGEKYRDATFMGVMRKTLLQRLRVIYPNVSETFGYITKSVRIEHQLPKEHYIDARCISGHPDAKSNGTYYLCKKVRCHNRQLHKATINKGGYRKNNQAPKYVFGYQLFDKVKMPNGEIGFVFGRRKTGSFDIRKLDNTKLSAGITYKKLLFLQARQSILIEGRMVAPSIS